MVPSVDQVTEYFHSAEKYVVSTVSAASPELPNVREALNRLWEDVSRFGPPTLAEIKSKMPVLGDFELPPPPPPPVHKFWHERAADWANDHRWTIVGVGAGVVGTGLLVGYASAQARSRARIGKMRVANASERRQVVVLLGGDHPLALPIIHELEQQGYIIIASVESPEYVQELERKCNGFVRALALDPSDSNTIPQFLRSLASALSRRFPINASGDPHASPSSQPYIHSVVSLLSLPHPASSSAEIIAPLEHLSLSDTYLSYLQRTHLTPLQVIQSLLPLLRSSPARVRDKAERSIVMCLPAAETRVGAPFAGAAAMSAAASLRAVEVLRHEITVAASGPQGEGMRRLRVVALDVGSVGSRRSGRRAEEPAITDPSVAMEGWTNSEKSTYGLAFLASLEEGNQHRLYRMPSPTSAFAHKLVGIIKGGRGDTDSVFGLVFWNIGKWMRCDRVAVGAGAGTYAVASNLPPVILDILLNIPSLFISIRNAFLPIQPYIRPRAAASAVPPTAGANTVAVRKQITAGGDDSSPSETEGVNRAEQPRREEVVSDIETGSEADVESNTEHDSGAEHEGAGHGGLEHDAGMASMASSWVNLSS